MNYVRMYVPIYVGKFICMYVRRNMYVCMYIRTFVTYIRMHIRMCVLTSYINTTTNMFFEFLSANTDKYRANCSSTVLWHKLTTTETAGIVQEEEDCQYSSTVILYHVTQSSATLQ